MELARATAPWTGLGALAAAGGALWLALTLARPAYSLGIDDPDGALATPKPGGPVESLYVPLRVPPVDFGTPARDAEFEQLGTDTVADGVASFCASGAGPEGSRQAGGCSLAGDPIDPALTVPIGFAVDSVR